MSFLSKLFAKRNSCRDLAPGGALLLATSSTGGYPREAAASALGSDDEEESAIQHQRQHPATRAGRRQALDHVDARASCQLERPEAVGLGARRPRCPRRSQSWDVAVRSAHSQVLVTESRLSTASASSDGPTGPSEVLLTNYRLIQHKYRGSNCDVMEAVAKKSSQPVTIKAFRCIRLTETLRERRLREVEVLQATASVPHVMRFVASVETEDTLYTIVERSPGVTLIELMANSGGHLSEDRCRAEVAVHLVRAVAGLHALGIVHRHLKPEHLICSKASLTVVDFTDAAYKKQHCLNSRVGDLHYMAPEVLVKPRAEDIFHQVLFNGMAEEELPQYDEKADVFSIGAILFEALTGTQPFVAETAKDVLEVQQEKLAVVGNVLPAFIAQQQWLSQPAREFLALAMQQEPSARPSAAALLQHAWLQSLGCGCGGSADVHVRDCSCPTGL